MVDLDIFHRTLAAYRHSLLVNEEKWITSRTPFYYLDLAAPNDSLFKFRFKELFPESRWGIGYVSTISVSKEPRFHPDDIRVGCDNRMNPNLFYHWAMFADDNVDRIGMEFFSYFWNNYKPSLTSGQKAAQFLNLAKLTSYQQWRERIMRLVNHRPCRQLFVYHDRAFSVFYPSILKGIYEKKSENPVLVKELWEMFCLKDSSRLTLFMNVPDAEHLKFMLEAANKFKFEFWGLKCGKEGLIELIVIDYIRKKRFELITVLLEYGFALGEMDKAFCNFSSHNSLTHAFFDYTRREFTHNTSMLQFLVRCYESWNNLIEIPEFIELLQKLSRSTPQPSLPPSIVRMHLQKAFEHSSRTAEVEEIIAIYEACDIHPAADCSVVAPPQLRHLSRCAIRERLASNCQLPTAIDDSYLPKCLKSYLRLDS